MAKKSPNKALYNPLGPMLLALGLFLSFSFLDAVGAKKNKKSQARQWFEYAYSIEEKAPQRAMQMYAWALEKGLHEKGDPSLARTAYWRLYYLYSERQYYLKAFLLLKDIQKWNKRKYKDKELQRLKQNLALALQKDWGLSKADIRLLFTALQALRNSKGIVEEKQNDAQLQLGSYASLKGHLTRVLKNNSKKAVLRKSLLALLIKEKKITLAKEILDSLILAKPLALKKENYLLEYASLEIEEGAYAKSGYTLNQIEQVEKIEQIEKMQFYYLWGRIERGLQSYSQSAKYFQKAASFGQRQSLKAQAAYSLYLGQNIQKAFALLSAFQPEPHTDEEILYSLLEIKLAKAKKRRAAKRKLKKMRPYLEAKSAKGRSLLARKALALRL